MNLIRLFFDSGAAENGGAAPADTSTENNQQQPTADGKENTNAPVANIPENAFTIDELKQFGFDSKEKFVEFLNKSKETQKTDADKEKDQIIAEANMMRFAAERDLITDDLKNYKSLQAKTDRDLVYEGYLSEWKEENPDITDETEIAVSAKKDFEHAYKLDSENAKAKTKGEAKLAKEASEIRKPSTEAWKTVNQSFSEATQTFEKNKQFKSIVKDITTKAIPDKLTLKLKDGETELPLDVAVEKEIRDEVEKMFGGEKGFVKYLVHEGTPEEFSKILQSKIDAFVESKANKAAVQKAFELGIGIGTKKGSTVGAENLFGLNQGNGGQAPGKVLTMEQSNQKIAEARQRVMNNRK